MDLKITLLHFTPKGMSTRVIESHMNAVMANLKKAYQALTTFRKNGIKSIQSLFVLGKQTGLN